MRSLIPATLAAAIAICAPAEAARMSVRLTVGEGRLVQVPVSVDAVTVARPEVADAQAPSPNAIFIFGKAAGRSSIVILNRAGRPIYDLDVTVEPDVRKVESLVSGMTGGAATARGVDGAIRLEGTVRTPAEADAAQQAARQAVGNKPELVQNRLSLTSGTQVNLRVRVAEVSRSVIRELGVNFEVLANFGAGYFGFATGRDFVDAAGTLLRSPNNTSSIAGGYRSDNLNINGVIDALAQNGLVTILAEPNLVVRSGQTGSFLSGGEFPIPVANSNNTIQVEFKRFGVGLDFTPTVMDDGRISLYVRPEVSQLDRTAGVRIGGIDIPGLQVRRVETTVELASGQTFAIAGLLQANSNNSVSATPWLSDIPILGALFRSTRFQNNESELIIMITPYIVEPAASPRAISTPLDRIKPALSFESLFFGRLIEPYQLPKGDTGFIVE